MAKNDNLIVVKNDGSVISTTSSSGTGSYITVTTGNGTTTTINKDNYITVVNGNGTTTTVHKDDFATQPISGGSATTQALINAATSGSSTSGGITTVTVDKDDFNTQPTSGGTATVNDLINGLTATQEKTFALSKVFEIYISGYNSNGSIVSKETLLQKIPAESENGLRLINPVVKNEMGVAESFDFSIEPGTKFYDAFLQMKTYLRVVYDSTTIFYGRVITIDSNSFRGTRKIRCEGPLAFLLDSPVEGVEEKKRKEISIYDYLKQLIDNHNSYINQDANKKFYLGEVPGHYSSSVTSEQQITDSKKKKYGSDSWTDTKSAIEDLRSHYGGYLRTRLSDKIGSGIYLDWLDCYFNSTVNTQTVEVGKNILDISSVTELENIFTAIIPIGKRTVRKENSSGSTSSEQTNLYLKGKILKVPDITSCYSKAELNFGYHKYEDYANAIKNYGLIFKTVNFSDADTEDKLKAEACEWIKNNYQGEVMKFTIKAVDMRQIGQNVRKIMVGDRVKISYRVGNEAGKFTTKTTTQTCISVSFDLYHPENNSYTFGVPANILTKTYGVTKQATSVANNSSNPPTPDTPGGGAPERSWFEYASGWLMRHKEHFSLYPPTRYTDEMGTAGQSSNELYLYEPGPSVLNPTAPKHSIAKSVRRIYYIMNDSFHSSTPQYIDNAKISDLEDDGYTIVRIEYLKPTRLYITGALTEQLIYDCYVCEWVKQEYGYDLRSELPVPGSQTTTTSNGETMVFDQVPNPETGVPEYVTVGFDGAHVTTSFGPNGETIVSMQDENGDWHYYYKDAKGRITETSIRDLKLEAISTDKFIGSMVTSGYFDDNGKPVMYKFGQGIEEWANGEMVVATVEGDVVRIGNEHTQWSTTVAQKINGNFLGCTEYIVDPVTGDKAAIKIGSVGQVSYKARWDKEKGCYVYDKNGNVEITGDGIWDTSNLAFQGGIMTVSDPDTGVKTTYINADRIIVGDIETGPNVIKALQDAGVLDGDADPQALVAKTIYTKNINALNVRCETIEADYVSTKSLKSRIANLDYIDAKSLWITAKDGYVISPKYMTSDSLGNKITYDDFTIYFGNADSSQKFLAESVAPGPGVSSSTKSYIGLKAEELDDGKIKISLRRTLTNFDTETEGIGCDGTGSAVFSIAATKAYKDGVAAAWNNARSDTITIIPTEITGLTISGDTVTSILSTSSENVLTVKRPKAYSTYYSKTGDDRYTLYNYEMAFCNLTHPQSTAHKAIMLKSNISNNPVAVFDINTEWTTLRDNSWNDARSTDVTIIPTTITGLTISGSTVTSALSTSSENILTIKRPETYSTYHSKTGDARYTVYNYVMAFCDLVHSGTSGTHKAIMLKSNTSNKPVAVFDINTEWTTLRDNSWNDARSTDVTIIPTTITGLTISGSTVTSALSTSSENILTIKRPGTYSTYHSKTGDSRYTVYNYVMAFCNLTHSGTSGTHKAIMLKSNTSNNPVAVFDINTEWTSRYNDGWNDARDAMVIPAKELGDSATKSMTVQKPNANGSTKKTSYKYTMSLTSHKPSGGSEYKCIDLTCTTGNVVVARLDINKAWNDQFQAGYDSAGGYNNGWNDARNAMIIPVDDIQHATTKTMSVYKPKADGSTSHTEYKYTMSLTSHKAPGASEFKCINLTYGNGNVVARLDINTSWNSRYNEGYKRGWNDCRGEVLDSEAKYYTAGTYHEKLWTAPSVGALPIENCRSGQSEKTVYTSVPAEKY